MGNHSFRLGECGRYPPKKTPMADRQQLYNYKGNKCWKCGLSVAEMVERYGTFNRMFEFNHVEPDKKHPKYDNLIRRKLSREQIDEVDKCVLVCRECHGILHAQGIDGNVEITLTIDGQSATQVLPGNIIIDKKDGVITFLTNVHLQLIPYELYHGKSDTNPRLIFGTDLTKKGGLFDSIKSLPTLKVVTLVNLSDGEIAFQARHIEPDTVEYEFDIKFPFAHSSLTTENDVLWIQHGVALQKSGEILTEGVF